MIWSVLKDGDYDSIGGLWIDFSLENKSLVFLIDHLINIKVVMSRMFGMLPIELIMSIEIVLLQFGVDFLILEKYIVKKCDNAKQTLSMVIGEMKNCIYMYHLMWPTSVDNFRG